MSSSSPFGKIDRLVITVFSLRFKVAHVCGTQRAAPNALTRTSDSPRSSPMAAPQRYARGLSFSLTDTAGCTIGLP